MHQGNSLISPSTKTTIINILDSNHDNAMLLVNHEGIIQCANRCFVQNLQVDMERLYGKDIAELLSEDSFEEIVSACRSSSELSPVIRLVNDEGVAIDSRVSIFVLADVREDEQAKPYYMMTFHDVCEKTGGDELLKTFPVSFMRDVNLGVMIIDMGFRLIDISETACAILGIEREDVLNLTMEEAFANVPIEHQLVQRSILDGQIVRNHAMSWMNNTDRYELLMDSNVVKNKQGKTIGAFIIFKDVSNLRSLEEQVQRSDRLAMIGQISAGTAHEIRNPLTSIKGFLQILNKTMEEKGMDKEFQYTEIMLNEIDRINNLVSEFLLLSKPKNALLSKINLSTVIKEILPIITNEALLYNVAVKYEPGHNLPSVVADRELLKQVCLNISKNGIEAMGIEGGTLTLKEGVNTADRRVHIEISDTGPGIPSFLIDKIFDPFFTTKEKGTGLGLSVCQRIVHDMGGTIRVSSKGFGTTFMIGVPYSDD